MKQAATLLLPLLIGIPLTLLSAQSILPSLITSPEISHETPEKAKISLSPSIPAASLYQLMAAEMALDRDKPEIALANYIAAAKETQDAQIAARATQIALTVASLELALEPATIWAKAAPTNLEAQVTTAALYIRLNQLANALPYLRQSEKVNADESFQYFLILFRQLQKEEDSARVVQTLQMLAKEETQTLSAHLALAEIYLFQNKEAQALEITQSAIKIQPNSQIVIQLRAEALLRSQGKEVAKTFLEGSLSNNKENVALRQYYTQFLIDQGFTELAKKEMALLIKNPQIKGENLLQLARICIQAQWFDLAEKILNTTRQANDTKDLSHYFLARLAEMQDKDQVAIKWFKQVLTGPFHVLSQVRASLLLAQQKEYPQALEVLARTQPTDSNDSKQIILATVEVLNQADKSNQALELLSESIKNAPDDVELHYARGLVAERLNQLPLAEADLKMILVTQPNHLEALNALGYLLASHTTRYDDAQNYLNQALKLSPNNAQVLDSIGWLYYKKGDYQQAVENLQKAAQLTPDAEIAAHLGEVLWKMKDYTGAKKIWDTALKTNPNHDQLLKVMKQLTQEK